MMTSFEWGNSKWDVDKAAESLNTNLFGGKKMKKKAVIPDNEIRKNNLNISHDSDDEQLSKKARKRMKERMRKRNKKKEDNNLNHEKKNVPNEKKQLLDKDKLTYESLHKKMKKTENTPKNETSEKDKSLHQKARKSDKGDIERISDDFNKDGKKILNKKARKRMKERMRKRNKKKEDNSHKNEEKNVSDVRKHLTDKVKLTREGLHKKIRKTENTPKSGTLESKEEDKSLHQKARKSDNGDMKVVSDDFNKDRKKKKRKRSESDLINAEKDVPAKKAKSMEIVDKGGDGEEQQNKKKRRRNKKKKNNSKKNKYKHLVSNSKTESDKTIDTLNSAMEIVTDIKSDKNISKQTISTLHTHDTISSSNSGQKSIESVSGKKKRNKRKADNSTKEQHLMTRSDEEISGNIGISKELTSNSSGQILTKGNNKTKKKKGDTILTKAQLNGKPKHRLDKQKLRDMLNISPSNNIKENTVQAKCSEISSSNSKKNKEKKRKRDKSSSKSKHNITSAESLSGFTSEEDEHFGSSQLLSAIKTPAEELKDKATEKLNAARFRYINEQLYTCKGHEAVQLFRQDKDAFKIYHQGFQSQTTKWPMNPLNAIIKHIKNRPKELIVADFGCGDARLSHSVQQKVFSFDLVALNDKVTACDMSKTHLSDDSIDIAVFCLSLMGTNLNDYILEANRVLKLGGLLKIAEVSSRFHSPEQFIKQISSLGFQLLNKRELSDMFYLMDFKKEKRIKKSPFNTELRLKPCFYKKR